VDKDIFQPRLPSYVKKMDTKDRKIQILTLDDMTDQDELNYGLNGSPTQVQKIFPPETNDKKEIWNGSGDMLAKKLFDKVEELKFV
jgi:electron transfer flavoprotein beta subunit